MASEKDRRAAVLASTTLNGIDFVEVATPDQETLHVHFLNGVSVSASLTAKPTITGGDQIKIVEVFPIAPTDWLVTDHVILTLRVPAPGDFSFYTLTISGAAIDPYFETATFSFKALCDSDLDCAEPDHVCPPIGGDPPPINYMAKDFLSFREALLEFSSLRYPEWQERSEADFGMMFLEALSALGDDLSYTQDRVAAQARLDTATERHSIVQLARLVDYEPRPATVARVVLQLQVTGTSVPTGLAFSAPLPDGGTLQFETGNGLRDSSPLTVDPRWNRIVPYYWDDAQRCLRAGSTDMWVEGHGLGLDVGQALLIDTRPLNSADPPIREIVHVKAPIGEQSEDQIYPTGGSATPVTHVFWDEPLTLDHDLTPLDGQPRTVLCGNLVPATQGMRLTETFAAGSPPASAPDMPTTFIRIGANSTPDSPTPTHRFSLPAAPLAWLAPETPDPTVDDPANWPIPEVVITQRPDVMSSAPKEWGWRRRLLDAEPFESAFTVDPARYQRFAQNSDGINLVDYTGDGDSIRFGDGIFGETPTDATVFDLTYRVGAGAAGNVAADSIVNVSASAAAYVAQVTNPFAADGGADPETNEQVRRRAPQAFRARQFRIVRPEDYIAAAESLQWVQRAGTDFRWTGSWLTVFTTADPRGSATLLPTQRLQLINLLNRRRMAGYESYSPSPRNVSFDLKITVCACPDTFTGDVHEGLLIALSTSRMADGVVGFFHPDLWTFGQPLERSRLEAVIQSVPGVSGVTSILYRRRGITPQYLDLPDSVPIAPENILRVENNPGEPEHGTIEITIEGGK